MPGLSRTGNRIEPPFARARRSIVGADESADAVFATGYSHEHEVLNHQRSQREAVALGVLRRSRVPNNISCLAVQRDDVRVQRRHKNLVAEDRKPAVDSPTARPNVRRQRLLVLPNGASGPRIQRVHAVVLSGTVQNSVDHQRRRFEFAACHRLISPLGHKRRHIRNVNLVQRAEAMPRIISRVHQPVLRLLGRIEQPLGTHLRRSPRRRKTQRCGCKCYNAQRFRRAQDCHYERREESAFASSTHRPSLHCPPPFSLAASKNAIMSFNSFSGSAFASYAGINDSRVFTYDRSLLFSNACNCSRVSSICTVKLSSFSTTPCSFVPSEVTTVTVSYSWEKSFSGSEIPSASRLLGLRNDSVRYSTDRDAPVELRSGPKRPPLPFTMWQVPQPALP